MTTSSINDFNHTHRYLESAHIVSGQKGEDLIDHGEFTTIG